MRKELVAFDKLLNIMDDLREKCPWDKEQTFESLRHLTIEDLLFGFFQGKYLIVIHLFR